MKKNRITYLCLLGFFLLMSIIKHSYFSNIILYTLLFLPIFSLIHIIFTYFNFRFSHQVDERIIVKGDYIQYTCEIYNSNKILVYCPMKVKFINENLFYKEGSKSHFFTLFPGQVEKIQIPIECKYRGNYNIGVKSIVIMDYFGLIHIKYDFIETIKLLVYPNIEKIRYYPIKPVIFENSLSLQKNLFQDKTNIYDVKDYSLGDPLNQIHWKLSAKYNELKTKQYSSSLQKKTFIFLDNQKFDKDSETNIVLEDLIIEALVSISDYLLKRQIPVELYYHDKDNNLFEGINYSDWDTIYEVLAKVQFLAKADIERLIKNFSLASKYYSDNHGANIIFASNRLSESIIELLNGLKLQGFEITLLLAVKEEKIENSLLEKIEDLKIKIFTLKQGKTLQTIIEGDYFVS
ncbi:uncharacterized protein DUF58 [Natranaerovirga pectinivora]|uniref:Uncharacterized protein DUF58 n=1 Tax=Natranaerovirga pectinivora TaxID=682400 RepID=A0A4R3MRA6_9FIRM|nr:DUF58 domain-containing protein [Natranaerovirga pectinivora]TCT16718.1 uncharacterized protein DUF58 [Natranaerovirga pectinivora]